MEAIVALPTDMFYNTGIATYVWVLSNKKPKERKARCSSSTACTCTKRCARGGDERASYGKQVLKGLSERLEERYGRGFSVQNLENVRKFYVVYARRGEKSYPAGRILTERERLPGQPISAREVLRSPLVLEFLDLPDSPSLHESDLERAIIENLQSFLLELGKGFALVARQKHVRFDDDDFYIDLDLRCPIPVFW